MRYAAWAASQPRLTGRSSRSVVYIDEWRRFLNGIGPANLNALEISPGAVSHWKNLGFRSYRAVQFPDFDITRQSLPESFDVIIAEHVWEHLRHPYPAARNVKSMLAPNGHFLITTPFLVRLHLAPKDYTRWTPDGMAGFLEDCGFDADVRAWGSVRVVRANFSRWPNYGWWRNLHNEPKFPIVVWAYARLSA